MKVITLDQFVQDPRASMEAAQKERVIVTREGKPWTVMVGIGDKDDEDLAYEASPEFWKMIRERRTRPTVSWEDVKAELLADEK